MRMDRMEIGVLISAKREAATSQIFASMIEITRLVARWGRTFHTMLGPIQNRHLFNICAGSSLVWQFWCSRRQAVQSLVVSVEFEKQGSGSPAR